MPQSETSTRQAPRICKQILVNTVKQLKHNVVAAVFAGEL